MNICLKTYAKRQTPHHEHSVNAARLPSWVSASGPFACDVQVEAVDRYYVVKLTVSGELSIQCQRCSERFTHVYHNQSTLAVCANDATAETLMSLYECMVAEDGQMDLQEVVADELYLFSPEKHLDELGCKWS